MKKIIDYTLITILLMALSSGATREYMIRTAAPDKPCTIAWSGEIHEYN